MIKRLLMTMAVALTAALSGGSASANNLPMPVMGGTSQPVGHYDFCKRYPDECQKNDAPSVVKLTRSTWDKIVEVNNAVNTGILPRTDLDLYGQAEYWTYPKTEGDCEDYVLLKQYMLERADLPRSALLVTVVRQPNGDGHAVLTVRTDRGDFVLDNLKDEVKDWKETEYRYLKRQSEKNSAKWVSIADDRDMLVGSVK
ncbi:MAG: transglutaminase [Sphingomonadales bacterium]|nr:MAG: transglutaminase [Sphingomonadales bacterium]